jgi:amidophosphoribosyltransferase
MTDDQRIRHKCGVAAVYCDPGQQEAQPGAAAGYLQKMLRQLQHRGEESAGITTWRPGRGEQLLDTHRDVGLVSEVFRLSSPVKHESLLEWYAGPAGIGHCRYATSGTILRTTAQPFETHGMRTWDWFSFGFNGNLANFAQLKRELEATGHRNLATDTEIIRHLLWHECGRTKRPDPAEVFASVARRLDGGYCIVFINADGDLIAARDPLGLRPLCFGERDGLFAAASESVALAVIGIQETQPVAPGELIHVTGGKVRRFQFAESPRTAYCFFEWIYFADVGSVIDDVSVYDVRYRLGQELAKVEPLRDRIDDSFIVVPVPFTSKTAAEGLAHDLGVPLKEGLQSNRYVGRTFIQSSGREARAREKYVLLPPILKGKKVLLVEDTIVRGLTLSVLLDRIRKEGGAAEVHVRVSCPPLISPCSYGIDMTTVDEFVAAQYVDDSGGLEGIAEGVRDVIGADSLVYQNYSGLVRSTGLPREALCDACITGQYPTPWGAKVRDFAESRHGALVASRSYEAIEDELREEDILRR